MNHSAIRKHGLDTGVSLHGESLANSAYYWQCSVESRIEISQVVKEIRRHGATVHPIMTKEATKVITPLAISWGTGSVITAWDSSMSQLGNYDAIVVVRLPGTRSLSI